MGVVIGFHSTLNKQNNHRTCLSAPNLLPVNVFFFFLFFFFFFFFFFVFFVFVFVFFGFFHITKNYLRLIIFIRQLLTWHNNATE